MGAKKIISLLLALSLLTGTVGSISACTPLAGEGAPQAETEKENVLGGGLLVTPEEDPEEETPVTVTARALSAEEYAENDIMPIAESAQQLTATLSPSGSEGSVDWSVAWKNPSSEWASGKTVTKYVTVTPTKDGALTANVSCLQDFGEQVIITAALRGTSAKATVTADYKQRVKNIKIYFSSFDFLQNIQLLNAINTQDKFLKGVTDRSFLNAISGSNRFETTNEIIYSDATVANPLAITDPDKVCTLDYRLVPTALMLNLYKQVEFTCPNKLSADVVAKFHLSPVALDVERPGWVLFCMMFHVTNQDLGKLIITPEFSLSKLKTLMQQAVYRNQAFYEIQYTGYLNGSSVSGKTQIKFSTTAY